MTATARYPEVTVHDAAAPSTFAARSQPEAVTSLGIGSLRASTTLSDRASFAPLVQNPLVADGPAVDQDLVVEVASTDRSTVVEERSPARSSGQAGQVLAIEECGSTVRVFHIARPTGFTFKPGQYVKLGVPGGKREDFSLASAPHEPHLELAIELREGGQVTPALFALRVGDVVEISDGAKGKLLLDPSASHHLMVATVTGIAPLLSMVRDALNRGTSAGFTVILGASYQDELPFHAELASLAAGSPQLTYVPTVSRPDEPANRSWTGAKGRADVVARVLADQLDAATTHVYAVGNSGMIASVVRELGGRGFTVSTESYD